MNQNFLKSTEYKHAAEQEGKFWGEHVDEELKYGIPFRVDYRRRTAIVRPLGQGAFEDDPRLIDIVMGHEYKTLINLIVFHARKNKLVLELGCGAGGLALELARHGLLVTGMDISQGSIDIAKQFCKDNPFRDTFGKLKYIVADLNTYGFSPQEKYDVICSNGGLHYILEFEALLQKLKPVLSDTGYIIFYDNIGETKISKLIFHLHNILTSGEPLVSSRRLKILGQSILTRRTSPSVTLSTSPKSKGKTLRQDGSPFEGITTSNMVDTVSEHFEIVSINQCQAFIKIVANILVRRQTPKVILYPLVFFLKQIDRLVCFLGFSRGENVLVVAQKKEAN